MEERVERDSELTRGRQAAAAIVDVQRKAALATVRFVNEEAAIPVGDGEADEIVLFKNGDDLHPS